MRSGVGRVTDLVARLTAALDAEEAECNGWTDSHQARMIAAHRKILALHAPGVALTTLTDSTTVTSCTSCGGWYTMKTGTEWPCDTVRALAEAYRIEA